MANAQIHANNSVKRFGGKPEDYLHLHIKMDCSKTMFPDNRHRALTHTMFWINEVMVPIYGYTIKNSDDKDISVKDICEQHVLEDYGMKFIPTVQDFFENMEFKMWMQNGRGEVPSSFQKIEAKKITKTFNLEPGSHVLDGSSSFKNNHVNLD